jgi:hypothetical protein
VTTTNDNKHCDVSDYEQIKGMTYREAKEYLISIGRWKEVEDLDGYSIVEHACYLKNKAITVMNIPIK